MALFGACEHCADARAQRDKAQATVDLLITKNQQLLEELMVVKRHDLGLPPKGFEPVDPTSVLGKRTWAAIEEVSEGFPDQRAQLINFAIAQTKIAMAEEGESDVDADTLIAHRIRQGDEA